MKAIYQLNRTYKSCWSEVRTGCLWPFLIVQSSGIPKSWTDATDLNGSTCFRFEPIVLVLSKLNCYLPPCYWNNKTTKIRVTLIIVKKYTIITLRSPEVL